MYHYQLFAGVEHGFALRGNPDDPYQRRSIQSFLRATANHLYIYRLGQRAKPGRYRRLVRSLAVSVTNTSLGYESGAS